MANRPTPYTISLAALISLHCQENSPLYSEFTIDELSKVDSFLRTSLLQISNNNKRSSWSDVHHQRVDTFLTALEDAVSSDVSSQLRRWLEIAASSIDALQDLMATIHASVHDGSVDAESANGIFLRSTSLGFDELPFDSVIKLWKDFRTEVMVKDQEREWTVSSAQVEEALREQCDQVSAHQRQSSTDDLQQLERILQSNPELPSAHFLKFLWCMQNGERVGATDALHQYLDYALIQSNEDILQFASILKAALHDEFGDRQLALAATEEAVRVAQQSQDTACVAFALGWLSVHNRRQTVELMQRCIQRASEGHLRPVVAGANLGLAKFSHSWAPTSQAISDNPPGSDAALSLLDRPTHIQDLDSSAQAARIAARQKLVVAGLWNHFGETGLSSHASSMTLQCHGEDLSATDVAIAIQNICRCSLVGRTEAEGRCIYSNAIERYLSLRQSFQLPVDGIFLLDAALVLHEWSVRRDELQNAETLLTAIEGHLNPHIHNYQELVTDTISQKALLRSRQGRWAEAKGLLRDRIEISKSSQQTAECCRLLLQLSIVQLEASSQQHHFTSTLPPLLECLTLSQREHMNGLHAAGLSILAQVHLRMGDASRAVSVLKASLPSLLQQEHVWLQAEAYLTLSKCYLKRVQQKQKRQKALEVAARELTRSQELFLRCQDRRRLKEVYFLLARVYNALPDCQQMRDTAATSFADLERNQSFQQQSTVMAALTSRDNLMHFARQLDPVVAAK